MLLLVTAVSVSFFVGLVAGWFVGIATGAAKATCAWMDAVRAKLGRDTAIEIAETVTIKAKIREEK